MDTTNMTDREIIDTAIAIESVNRETEAHGHAATMAHLAAQSLLDEQCDCTLCQYSRRHPQLNAVRCWEL